MAPNLDDLLNCVCQNGPPRPGVQEILDSLQRNTVCTGTQCFETDADAFGLTEAPTATQPSAIFFMMMMCVKPSPPALACRRKMRLLLCCLLTAATTA